MNDNVEASATKEVSDNFSKEQLEEFVENSLNLIKEGKPKIDGRKNLAACHYYNTDHGKIGTFCVWIKGTPFKIYVGTEKEVNEMKDDFYRIADEAGVDVKRTPKERAERRKKLRKKNV